MLTEHFIASVGVPIRGPGNNALKDAGIFQYQFQPLAAQQTTFKKSATPAHGLAVSDNHIFAAQTEKAVVHVYSRLKCNQEATIPFPERITSISLACDNAVLVLGTVEGRIFLWEVCSGRQIATPQAHLQAVTVLAVDTTSSFLLSGSQDSVIHIWSIPDLLSFSRTADPSPRRTFSTHRTDIVALVLGHSAWNCNFAVSASADKTCLIWDYRTGHVLRTYLLPGIPTSLALDHADRAVYVGYDDGFIQPVVLYSGSSGRLEAVQNGAGAADLIQLSSTSRWKVPDAAHGACLALSVSFDGSMLISGHASGSILAWDAARGSFKSVHTTTPLPGPVNNLTMLPVQGLHKSGQSKTLEILQITKPKYGAFSSSGSGNVPEDYTLQVQFAANLRPFETGDQPSMFETALTARSFPTDLLDEGIQELYAFRNQGSTLLNGGSGQNEDFVALDGDSADTTKVTLEEENSTLRAQLEALRRVQKVSFEKIERLGEEKQALLKRERSRAAKHNQAAPKRNTEISDDDGDTNMDETD